MASPPVIIATPVDGIALDSLGVLQPSPGLIIGAQLKAFGQPSNNVSGATANQWIGSAALPALAAGAAGTVTYTNSFIKAASRVFITVRQTNAGDTPAGTVPAAGALASLIVAAKIPGAGSIVFDVRNAGVAATLATNYTLDILIINGV